MAGSIALMVVASLLSASAWSGSYILFWNSSASQDVVRYNVYYGGATRTYTNVVPLGNVTNATISGLLPGAEYFFTTTAVDNVGLESVFSNEISYQVPGGQPGPTLPPINWPTPAAIVYGTALGAGQLNATSSVPGIFIYNPPSGAVLGAGNHLLWVTFNPTATNSYLPVTTNVALLVLPAALTITPANTSKPYGAALPALTASYSGFVNGDTPGSLTSPPALSTTATAASPVGSYPITAGGAASPNYTIRYAGGTLTVNKAALRITANNASKLRGAPLPPLTASYSGFVNGDTARSLTTPPTLTTTATANSPPGTYPITASGAASPNYAISYVRGTLTVTKYSPKLMAEASLSGNLAVTNLRDGSVAISGAGIPGFTYIIQYTTNTWPTSDWLTLGTVTADFSGAFILVDRGASPQRFYRAVYP